LLSGLKVSYAEGLREKRAVYGKVMGLIFTFILIWGCLISQSRAAILASLFTIPLFFLLKSYRVMFITYLFAFVILVTLIFSSKYILEKNLLHRYQHEIAPKITEVTGIKPRYFTLATMHIRLEGWANIVNNPEFQKPFGNRKLVKETKGISRQQRKSLNLETHDMISSLLLNFGWVSLLFLCVVGGAVLRKRISGFNCGLCYYAYGGSNWSIPSLFSR